MKKYLLFLFALTLCSFGSYSQKGDGFYYYNKSKIDIPINEKFIVVYYDQFIEDALIDRGDVKDVSWSFGINDENAKVFEICNNANYGEVTSNFRKNINVKSVEPVVGDSILCSNHFYVKLVQVSDTILLKHLADSLNCNVVRTLPYCNNWYEIESLKGSNTTVITKANIFYESGLFDKVDYGFILRYSINCVSDPLYSNQWGVNENSTYKINACDAWSITTGNSNVKVAVLDQGIEQSHQDFTSSQFVLSYDTETQTTPAVVYDNHGTHVGGIIFAKHNNIGIAGVAPDVSAINISNDLYITSYLSANLAIGISYAVSNNADVINNSWGDQGHIFYDYLHDVLLESEIDNAITNGRNGKGCIVVFASGNHAPTIDYPADYSSEILTVGSISSSGERTSFSAYGNLLDVVAPGDYIYSLYPNNSYQYLNGTSMAAPHVSGVAALMLSVNPNLTGQQVRNIIDSTAQRILTDLYTYTDVPSVHPNGEWNNQMGYGLVDAHAAVMEAYFYGREILGNDIINPCNTTYPCNGIFTYNLNSSSMPSNTTLQ